jgi:hypothetical protein
MNLGLQTEILLQNMHSSRSVIMSQTFHLCSYRIVGSIKVIADKATGDLRAERPTNRRISYLSKQPQNLHLFFK